MHAALAKPPAAALLIKMIPVAFIIYDNWSAAKF